VPQPKKKSKKWNGFLYPELLEGYDRIPKPCMSNCRSCSTDTKKTMIRSTNPEWPDWLNDTQGKWQTSWQGPPIPPRAKSQSLQRPNGGLPNYESYESENLDSFRCSNYKSKSKSEGNLSMHQPRISKTDRLLAFMGDNQRLREIHYLQHQAKIKQEALFVPLGLF
jgi:hypothetical protein